VVYAHGSVDYDHDKFFAAYTPQPEDGCYIEEDGDISTKVINVILYMCIVPKKKFTRKMSIQYWKQINFVEKKKIDFFFENNQENSVCWWHMADGKVLGVHNGMVLEYDASTLAPLGLVVGKDELKGKKC
jgi:hypothetical protein